MDDVQKLLENRFYVGQKKSKRVSEHSNADRKPNITKSNLPTDCKHGTRILGVNNMTLLKSSSCEDIIMSGKHKDYYKD